MIPTLQRTYSKAKKNANGVTWTAQQPIPVVFNQDGLVNTGTTGLYQVTAAPVYVSAYQVSFTVPGQDPGIYIQISLVDQNNLPIPGSTLNMYGCQASALQIVAPPYLAKPGTSLQFNINVLNGIDQYLPQDCILTYFLNYANGLPGYALWP